MNQAPGYVQTRTLIKGEGWEYRHIYKAVGIGHPLMEAHLLRAGKEEIEVRNPFQLQNFLDENELPRLNTKLDNRTVIALKAARNVLAFSFDKDYKMSIGQVTGLHLKKTLTAGLDKERQEAKSRYEAELSAINQRSKGLTAFTTPPKKERSEKAGLPDRVVQEQSSEPTEPVQQEKPAPVRVTLEQQNVPQVDSFAMEEPAQPTAAPVPPQVDQAVIENLGNTENTKITLGEASKIIGAHHLKVLVSLRNNQIPLTLETLPSGRRQYTLEKSDFDRYRSLVKEFDKTKEVVTSGN